MKGRRAFGLGVLTLAALSGGCLTVLGIDEDYQLGAGAGSGGAAGASGSGGPGVAGSDGATSGGGEVFVCAPETVEPCYSGPEGTEGIGTCHQGTRTCATDGSSWGPCEDEVSPMPETCNGLDDDCDSATDEDLVQTCYSGPPGTLGAGACQEGEQTCVNGVWGACQGEVVPAAEACNAVDDDCDGTADEYSEACYTGPSGTSGTGACHTGARTCSDGAWGECTGQQTPVSESCNDVDDDCDGQIDDGVSGDYCNTGLDGICASGVLVCSEGALFCSQMEDASTEIECNDLDDDCDGAVDECFVAGTPIAMADGTQRPIEQVQVGDWVLAYDVEAGRVTPAPVLRAFIHEQHAGSRPLLRINSTIRVTPNHPFYANGRWMPASELSVSDGLLVLDVAVKDLPMVQAGTVNSLYTEAESETTFNLTVGTHHNYFAAGVLVHNKHPCQEPLP